MEYNLKGKKLIWDFDKTASKLKPNNLYIEYMWNMKDTVGYTDTCVAVTILSEDTFYFITYMGLEFTMKIYNNNVVCLKKQVTK